ncbi:MAG: PilN domain-containing protein [Pseudomonadota bacterium]
MATINLLPWREELRQERQKNFMTALVGTLVIAGLLVFAAHYFMNLQIDGQEYRNEYLRGQIRDLERDIERIEELETVRDNLIARKDVIEELQSSRNLMVHLFNHLAETLPEGITLNTVRQNNQTLTIEGTSESETRVSDYMRNLDAAEWMSQTRLNIVEREVNEERPGQQYRFEVQTRLAPPRNNEAEEG